MRTFLKNALHKQRNQFSLSEWQSKKKTISKIIEHIPSGSHIFIGNGGATPHKLVRELVNLTHDLVDTNIIQILNLGETPYLERGNSRFRTKTFYVDDQLYQHVKDGMSDYTPISLSDISRIALEGKLRIDVALIKVTPPNEKGFCSLGVGVDVTQELAKQAKIVLAEVTKHMPWTEGDSLIPTSWIDYWVNSNSPLIKMQTHLPKDRISQEIGEHVAREIMDGSTLRVGIGNILNSIWECLHDKKDLGIHTELMIDPIMLLMQKGVINNSKKRFHPGKSIVTHAVGSKKLYQWLDRNPHVEFHPVAYTNDWRNIAKNRNVVSLSQGYEIDLTGQVCADSKGDEFAGGFGGTSDFQQGAKHSKHGKSIVVFTSKKQNGHSSIVSALSSGAGVVITRAEVDYVATEYGVVHLRGKTIRERCLALIQIAHPQFRDQLLSAAKRKRYVHPTQPGVSFQHRYPIEWETLFINKKQQEFLARPVKATDEDKVQDFFHSLSDHSIYLRYFRHMHSLPHKILQGFVDIDYSQNMTIIILNTNSVQKEIVAMGQWVVDVEEEMPELAFQVSDSWQGHGLGTYLMQRLITIAKTYNYSTLKANVLAENRAMRAVMEKTGYLYRKKFEFGVYTYYFHIFEQA